MRELADSRTPHRCTGQTSVLLRPRGSIPPEIAVVNHKGEAGRVDVLHDVCKFPFMPPVIWNVADEREVEFDALSVALLLQSRAGREGENCVRRDQNGATRRPAVQERQCQLIMLTSSRARYGIIARFAESAQVDVMEFSGTRNSTHAANLIEFPCHRQRLRPYARVAASGRTESEFKGTTDENLDR